MLHSLTLSQFNRWSGRLLPWLATATVCLIGIGLYMALFASPPDYQQGEAVRMMYVHVPSAWMALGVYVGMALASAGFLIWRNPLTDVIARNSAPIGAGFAFICLVTGSLWGKPIWGTWWVWDARLTSMLVLFFLYLGYMALANAFDNPERNAKSAAILSLVGVINVPIIKFSVEWWNTLHQPASVMKFDGPAIHSSILTPLLLMFGGFACFYLTLLCLRIRSEVMEKKIQRMRMKELSC